MAFIILISVYALVVLMLAFGFARLGDPPQVKPEKVHSISVVIAARNEEKNLPVLLTSLRQTDYPPDKWEVIIIDDHSDKPLDISIPAINHGKKAAIAQGISEATGQIIVTTDADCLVPTQWLKKINEYFQSPHTRMVVGGVRLDGSTLFSKLQSLEFVSVAATGAATIGLGIPTMCNGANLSFRKESFLSVDGYKGGENVTSGDDEFLMNKFHDQWKDSIRFLFDRDAVVSTAPAPTIAGFVSQRLRWAGKWNVNTSLTTRVFAMVIWLIHLGFIVMPVLAALGITTWKIFAIVFAVKIFAESVFLIPSAIFFGIKWSWFSFLILQFIYSFYVVAIGFMSQILTPDWKGRAVDTKV